MSMKYDWTFPLPRTHTGMLQGNGTFGAMIWGEGSVLRVTIGRADFWDHRGGLQWTAEMTYAKIRECLESGNSKALGTMFAATPAGAGEPQWPSVLPIGRIELDFGPGAVLTQGTLALKDGTATVQVRAHGVRHKVRLALDMHAPVLLIEVPKELSTEINPVTAWQYVGDHLASIAFTPPVMFNGKKLSGWVQQRPADPPLCVGYRTHGNEIALAAVIGDDPSAAQEQARALIDTTIVQGGFADVRARNRAWWKAYWKSAAKVAIPNERLQFLYDYGMYKFAGLTNPAGVPATLQGPWIEEYQMPPWSSDYHFNINVQMCYWPAYHGNRLEHLRPLFEMVAGWTPILRHNAAMFLGIDDGRMLPHSVDDRGTCIGGFWSGSLDHGCTAWVAQMMFRYYRYTMDETFLRETAYPFMAGAMRVYEGMLDRDGDTWTLPVSVSPEYHTKGKGVPWGRNASFQLACLHRLCEDLLAAADVLGVEPDANWRTIAAQAPRACLIGEEGHDTIAIWEGTPLEESHRHHSHMAGITPFDIFDLHDETWRERIGRTLDQWIYHGTGLWSGWCVPWAAMLHLRFDQGEAAELLLESWQRVYTNEGHGTLHDANIPGFTLFGPKYANSHARIGANEVMQMDAGMSCTTAIQEMLLHTRRGVNHLFAGAPARWRTVSFGPMRTDGAFLVSAAREAGVVTHITIDSPAGGIFKLANPWHAPARVTRDGASPDVCTGDVLEISTVPGERVVIERE